MGAKKDDKKAAPASAKVAPAAPVKGVPVAKGTAGKGAAAPVAPAAPVKGAPVARGRGGVPVAAPPVEAVVEKKKEKKSQKERPHSKKKHTKVQVWKKYKIEGGKVTRLGENCPRCGTGTFLAKYKNRKYCGHCGWAQISQ